jgi:hypothetical protein
LFEAGLPLSYPIAETAGMNGARFFMRREDYQPRKTPRDSPFRQFDVKCLHSGIFK